MGATMLLVARHAHADAGRYRRDSTCHAYDCFRDSRCCVFRASFTKMGGLSATTPKIWAIIACVARARRYFPQRERLCHRGYLARLDDVLGLLEAVLVARYRGERFYGGVCNMDCDAPYTKIIVIDTIA